MAQGDAHVTKRNLSTLRLLGSVGEPINPEAWLWYHRVVGHSKCPIMDTYWQTETGGFIITPFPCHTLKPGSATFPYYGIEPVLLDDKAKAIEGAGSGMLCIRSPWPGLLRTVYGQHSRLKDTYFATFPGLYFTGDGARRDEDGYYWITGRADDVVKVSGHRLGTAEIESAFVANPKVAEAAVVGYPHDVKGQGLYIYLTLKAAVDRTDVARLGAEMLAHIRATMGPIATPDYIHFTDGLPKTRSGKIMRRILRKIACNETEQIGDTSTLADPSVVEFLVKTRWGKAN